MPAAFNACGVQKFNACGVQLTGAFNACGVQGCAFNASRSIACGVQEFKAARSKGYEQREGLE